MKSERLIFAGEPNIYVNDEFLPINKYKNEGSFNKTSAIVLANYLDHRYSPKIRNYEYNNDSMTHASAEKITQYGISILYIPLYLIKEIKPNISKNQLREIFLHLFRSE